jgi:signal transduction histidine kinase
VAKVSAVAASHLDIDKLLERVAELTRTSFGQYRILIYLLDETGEILIPALRHYLETAGWVPPTGYPTLSLHDGYSLVARAAKLQQGLIVNDITSDSTSLPLAPDIQSEMAVPMAVADRLVGVLDIQSGERNNFTEADVRVMATLADLIAVAVQNARLYEQAQELAAIEERNRLARELHDSVSQSLYGIALGAHSARALMDRDPQRLKEPVEYILAMADAALTEMRALIFELRPESLENEGLLAALRKQVTSLRARHGLSIDIDFCAEPTLPLEIKETIYRIAREALHNIVKHAHASHIRVRIHMPSDRIDLEVSDDGQGFDPSGSYPGHLGLQSMRERAARLNGEFRVESQPGQGTHIFVSIPVNTLGSSVGDAHEVGTAPV